VTAPARLTQADIERATKAAAKVGGRVVIYFDKRQIEIIIGEAANQPQADEWGDDVV
jgi:hypothetical protein